MYSNNPYAQPQAWQPQQPGVPPPPPSGTAPPPPPGMTAEQAAQYSNYGYGSVPQRGGAGRGAGQNTAFRQNQQGQQQVPGAFNPGTPVAGAPYSPAHPGPAQSMHAAPSHQGAGHPHKRPRFDSGNHANAGLPQNPQYAQQQQPQVGPMQQQQPQQMQYAYPQQQPPLPPGPPPQMQPGQPYYQPVQQAYPMQQQPMQQQPMQQQAFSPQPVYYSQQGQPMMPMQPMQPGVQAYPPQGQVYPQPMQMQQNMHMQPQQAGPPPLAVAPMKPGGPKGGPGRKGRSQHALPAAPHLHPPPPPSEPPPPPAGPSGVNRSQSSTIKLSPKGAATLPPTPTGPANMPTGPAIPTGPSSAVSIKRDTRPLPSQSSTAAAARQDRHQQHQSDQRLPTGPSGRGGRGGSFGTRGGRGGPPSRGGFGDRRALGRSNIPSDARSNASSSSNAGNKRTFSQTSAGPAIHQKSARQRADSNVTITSQTLPAPSTKPFKNRSAKFGGLSAGQLSNSVRASSVFSTSSGKGGTSKKTLTDFRLESLEIPELGWSWKATPLSVIMERMVLKDKEREAGRHSTGDDEEAANVEVKEEEHDGDLDTVEQAERAKETADEVVVQMSLGQAPDSTAMQKSDSRREKRKHSGDDDDQPDGQTADNDDEDKVPLGKKVKSENTEVAEAAEAPQASEDHAPQNAESQVEKAVRSPEDSVQGAESPPAAVSAEEKTTVADETTPDVEAKTAAAAEMSASVEPESKPVPTQEDKPSQEREQEQAVVEPSEEKTAVLEEPSSTREPDQAEETSEQRKYRENSRLRIYFATPSEVPTAPPNKEKPTRGQKRRAKADLDAMHGERAMSVDTTFTDATAQPETCTRERDEQEGEQEDVENDDHEDLDGEPLGDNKEGESAPAEAGADGPNGTADAKDEEAEAVPPAAEAVEAATESAVEQNPQREWDDEPDPTKAASAAKEETLVPEVSEDLPEAAEDRVSISYGRNTRRLVLNAEIIEELRISRADGRVELKVKLLKAESDNPEARVRVCKGLAVETLASDDGEFEEVDKEALSKAWPDVDEDAANGEQDATEADELLPPLHRLLQSATAKAEGDPDAAEEAKEQEAAKPFMHDTLTIIAHLDKKFPLTEAKWVRSGKPDEWIESILSPTGKAVPKGQQAAVQSAWLGKIKVIDPEAPPPPPTFGLVLENWLSAANARLGFDEARYRFISTHFKDVNNVFEVLLRLIRGVNSYHYAANAAPAFAAAVEEAGPAYPEQQTPISLAAFQLFKLGIEAAKDAGLAQEEVDKKVGEVIRMLPFFQICKSLDSIFLDYKRASNSKDGKQSHQQSHHHSSSSQRQPPRRPFQQNQKRQRKNV